MENVPKLVIWEQISDHFSMHSYFAPTLRYPLWMRQTKGHVQICLVNFGCMSLSWILHNSNEGEQVKACLGKNKHISSPFACHWLLDYGSDLQEIMLAKSCSKGKMSKKCKINWSDIDGASPKPNGFTWKRMKPTACITAQCKLECDHDGFQSQRGCRKHVNTKHTWFFYLDEKPNLIDITYSLKWMW